jgi:hypothetical protein
MVIAPLFWLGMTWFNWSSMRKKLSGEGCQFSGLTAPEVLLTRRITKLKSVPDPLSGVKSSENAETRSTLIGPEPRMLADTFQLLAVSPAAWTNGVWKVTMVESKVKSPWNPT